MTPIELKAKLSDRIATIFYALILTGILIWIPYGTTSSSRWESIFIYSVFGGMSILAWYSVIGSFTVVTFDGQLFTWKRLLRGTVTAQLSQVSRIRHGFVAGKLILLDTAGSPLVRISETVPQYVQFFTDLRSQRPDLWPTTTATRFQIKWSLIGTVVFLPLLMLGVPIVYLAIRRHIDRILMVYGTIGLLSALGLASRQLIGLEILSDGLLLTYVFKKIRLSFVDITRVVLTFPGENNQSHFFLRIESGKKRRHIIRDFDVHEVLMFDRLRLLLPGKTFRASELPDGTTSTKRKKLWERRTGTGSTA